jgi:uncharacterized protein YfaS (alpha-2-macroglobulin family)
VTLRNVEASLVARSANGKVAPGQLANLKVDEDAAIIEWFSKLNRYHESTISKNNQLIETRSIGLLSKEAKASKLELPATNTDSVRPFEIVGIPFKAPGFYVLELESQRLGAALLGKPAPMFVRTSALVTNLSVHLKSGRENAAVWVTRLDNGKPVANADIQISDCFGRSIWKGRSDVNGIAMLAKPLSGCQGNEAGVEGKRGESKINGYFVSARKTDEKGRADMAFALSSWNNGIESYRFNLPTEFNTSASVKAHTVLDRSLFRAGETVSMKHLIRAETMHGLALVKTEQLPNRLRIVHQGSNQEFQFPVVWRGRNAAENTFTIPAQAKLGRYDIILDKGNVKLATTNDEGGNEDYRYSDQTYYTGGFRVEEFRCHCCKDA